MRTRSTRSVDREVDGGRERRELPFALGGRLLSEVVVTGAEMDVGRVDASVASGLWRASLEGRCRTLRDPGFAGPDRTAGAVRGSGTSEAPP